jgi:Tol biopolymer transport system component
MLGIQLFSADRVERPKTIVQGALFSAFAVSWSPDGRQLVYSIASTSAVGEASIYVIDANGGQSRLLVSLS